MCFSHPCSLLHQLSNILSYCLLVISSINQVPPPPIFLSFPSQGLLRQAFGCSLSGILEYCISSQPKVLEWSMWNQSYSSLYSLWLSPFLAPIWVLTEGISILTSTSVFLCCALYVFYLPVSFMQERLRFNSFWSYRGHAKRNCVRIWSTSTLPRKMIWKWMQY